MTFMKSTLMAMAMSTCLVSLPTAAATIIDGMYESAGDDRGLGRCTLKIMSLDQSHKYGEALFELESSGEGACEWTAIGVSKNFVITGGLVTSGGTPAFIKVTFPFGPAGRSLLATSFDIDGSLRNTETFTRLDSGAISSR